MAGTRDIRLVDEGDDTLTEGAVNFMVIEMRFGSLQKKLPFGNVVGFGSARVRSAGQSLYHKACSVRFCFFFE